MSLSKRKGWYSNNCLHFLKRTVPLTFTDFNAFFNVVFQESVGLYGVVNYSRLPKKLYSNYNLKIYFDIVSKLFTNVRGLIEIFECTEYSHHYRCEVTQIVQEILL